MPPYNYTAPVKTFKKIILPSCLWGTPLEDRAQLEVPWVSSGPQEPVGFEPREAHVAVAAALITGGTGGTWPPHLVWSLTDPVAPGREEVPGKQG